ncbi:MAG: Lrp/AsnC family transcriptional regulator [Rhodobacteraceae bacterium]|nr:Lrp/AsnC family transcriptional regulator [Paracoccaceae bacterium]
MLSKTDLLLLSSLQQDASMTTQELGRALDLSPSQASRRRQRLESEGYISRVAAHLDPARIGLSIQAFLFVTVDVNGSKTTDSFIGMARELPGIVGAWSLTGEASYLLRVFCADLSELRQLVHEVLLQQECVARVQSHIVLDQSKPDSPLPIPER